MSRPYIAVGQIKGVGRRTMGAICPELSTPSGQTPSSHESFLPSTKKIFCILCRWRFCCGHFRFYLHATVLCVMSVMVARAYWNQWFCRKAEQPVFKYLRANSHFCNGIFSIMLAPRKHFRYNKSDLYLLFLKYCKIYLALQIHSVSLFSRLVWSFSTMH